MKANVVAGTSQPAATSPSTVRTRQSRMKGAIFFVKKAWEGYAGGCTWWERAKGCARTYKVHASRPTQTPTHVCICAHTHSHTHTNTHTHTHTHTHTLAPCARAFRCRLESTVGRGQWRAAWACTNVRASCRDHIRRRRGVCGTRSFSRRSGQSGWVYRYTDTHTDTYIDTHTHTHVDIVTQTYVLACMPCICTRTIQHGRDHKRGTSIRDSNVSDMYMYI